MLCSSSALLVRLFLRVFRIVIYHVESTTRIPQHHVFCLSYLMGNVQLVQGDSELVIQRMIGVCSTDCPNMKPLFDQACQRVHNSQTVTS
jgi:hypothetical protein